MWSMISQFMSGIWPFPLANITDFFSQFNLYFFPINFLFIPLFKQNRELFRILKRKRENHWNLNNTCTIICKIWNQNISINLLYSLPLCTCKSTVILVFFSNDQTFADFSEFESHKPLFKIRNKSLIIIQYLEKQMKKPSWILIIIYLSSNNGEQAFRCQELQTTIV